MGPYANPKRLIVLACFALLAGGFILWPLDSQPQRSLSEVAVQLDWTHGTDFAGFYVASSRGYYTENALSVRFLEGGPKQDPVTSVVDGTALLGTAAAHHLLKARASGRKVRAISCIMQRSPLVFAALKGSNIRHPRDLAGKVIRLSKQNIPILAALTRPFGVDGSYTVVHTRELGAFYAGEIDVWGGYLTLSVEKAKIAGYRLDVIHPADFGVRAYHECIFARDDEIAADPARLARFLEATLRGWEFALRQPADAVHLSSAFSVAADKQQSVDSLRASRALIQPAQGRIGWMRDEVWQEMADALQRSGVITPDLNVDEAFTLRFLNEVYAKEAG